jgi:tRNA-dihydrouridine synthase 1
MKMSSKRKSKDSNEHLLPETKKSKKEKKFSSKEKNTKLDSHPSSSRGDTKSAQHATTKQQPDTTKKLRLPFEHEYIVAPMVGASELPFRLLCRKYGAQLVYTPMMMASKFATSADYRKKEFQTTPFDRPLVCHFAANNPADFAAAAKLAEPYCDAIDLNLGCPQRTAHVGHFGSYLLDPKERSMVVSIVKAGAAAVQIPIFVKIRLLDTFEETLELVRQLYEAGASLIAVHARYRATFHRKGAGARDGPALLDQVQKLKEAIPNNKLLITNGNTITYEDVVKNLEGTKADGIMSAEGILDNPALYLGRFGSRGEAATKSVSVKGGSVFCQWPRKEKLVKKLERIEQIAKKDLSALTEKEQKKLSKKKKIQSKLGKMDKEIVEQSGDTFACSTASLGDLYVSSDDKVQLALEYLQLVRQYPAILRTVIFHTRRMLKTELTTYQLMDECLSCTSVDAVQRIVLKIQGYQADPASFQYDVLKAKQEKEALERKKQEEGKRKAYEARMMRKAKREGKLDDLEFYLRQGAAVPTLETVQKLKTLSKPEQLALWKEREHSQHCMSFHLEGACPRGRACAFLHAASQTNNTFEERDEVAG